MRSELAIEPLVVGCGAATLAVFGERTVSSRRRRRIDGEEGVRMSARGQETPIADFVLFAAPAPPAVELARAR
jgi:hypothetical protein